MANTVGIRITADLPGLEEVRSELLKFGTNMSAKYMAAALKRAAEDGGTLTALKANTPKGRTGNLRRAVAIKTKRYVRTGVGIAIVGYKSGRKMNEPYDPTKQGYHQGLVEFGTKQRFRKSKVDGRLIPTGKMPVGGSTGKPPVRTAWEQTRAAVESRIVGEMKKAVENAAKDATNRIRSAQGPF